MPSNYLDKKMYNSYSYSNFGYGQILSASNSPGSWQEKGKYQDTDSNDHVATAWQDESSLLLEYSAEK